MGASEGRPITVLHVEDDADFAELSAIYLARVNPRISVVTAGNVEEGKDELNRRDIDCVVSDFDMPGPSGIDLLASIRETHRSLPFILFTGKGSEEIASDAISAGVTDYLQKGGGIEQFAVLANRIENVVERHRAEQLVDRAFRAMDRSREGIALLDEDGDFLYVNTAYCDIVGYSQEELQGAHWELVYPDEQVTRIYNEVLDSVPIEGRWSGETVYQRKDESRIVVDHALAYTDEGTMICLIRDHTGEESKVLQRERRRFDLFIDAVEEYAIYMLDRDGYVVSWNRGAKRLLGYDRDEVLGEHLSIFHPANEQEVDPNQLLDCAREEGAVEHRGQLVRGDGSKFFAESAITAVYDDEKHHRGFANVTRRIDEDRSPT